MTSRAKRFASLPEEITTEILLRLPTKSLIRFKCASQSWKSLLSSNDFVRAHFKRSLELRTYDLIKFNNKDESRLAICGAGSNEITSLIDGSWLDQKTCRRFNLVDSCSGVLCLSTFQKDSRGNSSIILYNPSIRKYKVLPQPSSRVSEFVGFGMDTSTGYSDDLKVINVNLTLGGYPNISSEVEVYSARDNSWKQLGDVFPLRQTMYLGKQVLFDKYICWCPYARLRFQIFPSSLVMYDIVGESFSEMALPSAMPLEKKYVDLLDSCLSIIACNSSLQCYEVWTMKDFPSVDSWTKLYSIEDAESNIFNNRPLGFMSSGNIIFVRSCSSEKRYDSVKELVSYERKNGKFKELNVKVDSFYSSQLFRYVESLNFP